MKTLKLSLFACITILMTMNLSSCLEDSCIETQRLYVWEPIYLQVDELRTQFEVTSPRELANPGKIYFYNNYIFIAERGEGIHTIDNSDPANPNPVNFIKVPGSNDMSVKNGRLYVDNYIDLLTIDISDPTQPSLTNRTEEVFNNYSLIQDLGYLIEYERTLETREIDCNSDIWRNGWGFCPSCSVSTSILADASFSNVPSNASAPSTTGIGGSFARFTIAKDHLYTVDDFSMNVFTLADCDNPSFLSNTEVGWGIETIFPLGENLFLGSNNGMFIYSIADATTPVQLSRFEHARACDPVYVAGDKAYVTLRDGNNCVGFINQLDIVDVSILTEPQLITSHTMDHPHGLSIQGDNLFICEGEFGLKAFDRSDDFAIRSNQLSNITDFHAYDIITLPNQIAMIIGNNGLYQYDISDPTNLVELSRISVNRE